MSDQISANNQETKLSPILSFLLSCIGFMSVEISLRAAAAQNRLAFLAILALDDHAIPIISVLMAFAATYAVQRWLSTYAKAIARPAWHWIEESKLNEHVLNAAVACGIGLAVCFLTGHAKTISFPPETVKDVSILGTNVTVADASIPTSPSSVSPGFQSEQPEPDRATVRRSVVVETYRETLTTETMSNSSLNGPRSEGFSSLRYKRVASPKRTRTSESIPPSRTAREEPSIPAQTSCGGLSALLQ